MAAILSSRRTFLHEVIPEGEYTRKIAMSISDILSFWSTSYLKYWRRYINFKIWPTLWPGDVINDVMSTWNITCTTRHPQQCTCKILFVWHQSFIVKSSGQTSWIRHKQTNTQGENSITSLTRVITNGQYTTENIFNHIGPKKVIVLKHLWRTCLCS